MTFNGSISGPQAREGNHDLERVEERLKYGKDFQYLFHLSLNFKPYHHTSICQWVIQWKHPSTWSHQSAYVNGKVENCSRIEFYTLNIDGSFMFTLNINCLNINTLNINGSYTSTRCGLFEYICVISQQWKVLQKCDFAKMWFHLCQLYQTKWETISRSL